MIPDILMRGHNPGPTQGIMFTALRILSTYDLIPAEGFFEMSGETDKEKREERLEYFLRMLKDGDPGKRWKAAEALARTGDERAVGPLIETLDDEDWRVRQKTAWALGYLGDPRALVPLHHAMKDDLEGVQEMIREAIMMIQRKIAGES